MKIRKKLMVIVVLFLSFVTLLLIGLTYAYYRTRVNENQNEKSISLKSGKLEVSYLNESPYLNISDVKPGYSNKNNLKTFTVKNTGDKKANYSIIFDNVENTFIRKEDWTFKLLNSSSEIIKSGVVPASKSYIINNISIDAGKVDSYTLLLEYEDFSKEDQSVDMGALLSLRINIDDAFETVFDTTIEGTLLKAIGNNNIINEPLTKPGQEPNLTHNGIFFEERLKNDSFELGRGDSIGVDRYYTYASSYIFNPETGKFTLNNPQHGLYSINSEDFIYDLVGKYVVDFYGSYEFEEDEATGVDLPKIYYISEVTDTIRGANSTLEYIYDIEYQEIVGTPLALESVFAKENDDYGISYYYRGGVENNYVNYSGMCWRIVRVQGDGSIKLVLADKNGVCDAESYNINNKLSSFVGNGRITYDSFGNYDLPYENSSVPSTLDAWATQKVLNSDGTTRREKNLDTSKLINAEWCNDVSVAIQRNERDFYFSAYKRLNDVKNASPTFKCDHVGLNNSTTKKYNSYIGILTADEMAFAGATTASFNYNHYLKTNATGGSYITLSSHDSGDSWIPSVFIMNSYGKLDMKRTVDIDYSRGEVFIEDCLIRPAVVLRSDVLLNTETSYVQDGTVDKPYVIG